MWRNLPGGGAAEPLCTQEENIPSKLAKTSLSNISCNQTNQFDINIFSRNNYKIKHGKWNTPFLKFLKYEIWTWY